MTIDQKHAEWLSLLEVPGAFLAVPVLKQTLPQGLEKVETPFRQRLRSAHDEWCEAVDEDATDLDAVHQEWVRLVLQDFLEYEASVLKVGDDIPASLQYNHMQSDVTVRPDYAVMSGDDAKLLITVMPPGADLENPLSSDAWASTPAERLTALCKASGVKLGLVTNGDRWMVIGAKKDGSSSRASWYARLWFQEPVTLQAFYSLLGVRRCFGAEDQTLVALIEQSSEYQNEITDTLGEQVRRAVEVLVQALDRADLDRNRTLLEDVTPAELFEAGLTVMMRLVVVLCAEERKLLLLGEPVYDQNYAISTLRSQLVEQASHGLEILERRQDAWSRLLAAFRGIYGGISHENLRLPPLGGSLFDPDRFPFLEGREPGTKWTETPAVPLPIDNRTVLLLLNALQVLEHKSGAQFLSYEALDVEQIGHVYEGLLERTVKRVPEVTLSLEASSAVKKKTGHPELYLSDIEKEANAGSDELVAYLKEQTGRSVSAITKALAAELPQLESNKLLSACSGDLELNDRIKPYGKLLRADSWGDPLVYQANAFVVAHGAGRRETGSHYTPKSLTELVVETTLEPLVYKGPAEGKPRDGWQLKSSSKLLELKICDPAMGSGAFLVEICRWLSKRLVEAWGKEAAQGNVITVNGAVLGSSESAEPMPDSLDERLLIARRLVAEKCLYGVDLNPLAVELAKLSIWLITFAKGRPFGFLDHNLRSGDSLLGLHKLTQLTKFSLHPERKLAGSLFASKIEAAVKDALALRKQLRETPIRDIRDIQCMERLDQQARQKLEHIEHIADAMIGEALASNGNQRTLDTAMDNLSSWATAYIEGNNETGQKLIAEARKSLSIDLPASKPPRKPFHWALEFPEVFERGGFDGVIGNPPYLGGKKIGSQLGARYRVFLAKEIADGRKGSADLCAYFILRSWDIIRPLSFLGFVSTSSIAEGDTREVCLDHLTQINASIIKAIQSMKWPGSASVTVTPIWLTNTAWNGKVYLDDKLVDGITPYLQEVGSISGKPHRLKSNSMLSFQGSVIHGKGFLLSKEEMLDLIRANPKNKEVIKLYLRGNDFNSLPNHLPETYVINFHDWPLSKASEYAECIDILRGKVKPERDKVKRKCYREKWWQFAEKGVNLYKEIEGLDQVLFHSFTSKYMAFSFVPSTIIFAAPHVVFSLDGFESFALLQSNIHEVWMRNFTSYSLSLARYTPTDCFVTFPFPLSIASLENIGEQYFNKRKSMMLSCRIGLTEIYNKFHDRDDNSIETSKLRELHSQLDFDVIKNYGWSDIELQHGFHETPRDGIRFTISEEARSEVLQRLLALNHERYADEVAAGLHDKKKKKPSRPRKKRASKTKTDETQDTFL